MLLKNRVLSLFLLFCAIEDKKRSLYFYNVLLHLSFFLHQCSMTSIRTPWTTSECRTLCCHVLICCLLYLIKWVKLDWLVKSYYLPSYVCSLCEFFEQFWAGKVEPPPGVGGGGRAGFFYQFLKGVDYFYIYVVNICNEAEYINFIVFWYCTRQYIIVIWLAWIKSLERSRAVGLSVP